ncbi:uncharacterized protein HKW66_Vig0003020 [Vigna angularis]|uniref:Peptidase M28 domain-containing protein n=1 Tax=Phaseolus angularis TaxID=3914 RepID=A0A8T0LC91_PHAAN|nr:uncharacterized protein HKW66_Vig0003020 [Vigna angularis]
MGFLFESDRDQNHINAAYLDCWMSSMASKETDPSVLVNGHFDSPLGSPGAGDCGSCVASMLEIARLIVDSGWVPHRPVIFLFNGAEELFMLGSHGFMKTHKWRDTIGAFINVEASGTGGPDLVCQSGPSSWPSNVYAEAAIYPMANSAAADVFPVIPGDTDYRIFSQDYGNIPGLDIIFLLGGYFYHTSSDTVERLLPGSIQARGENLFSIIKTFTNSSKLQNTYQTNYSEVTTSIFNDERAVFFDYFSWFMIFYSRRVAKILHSIPIFFLVFPFTHGRSHSWSAALCDFIKGIFIHTFGIILAVVVPVVFSILRLLLSSQTMNWFANPYLAFLMFVPCALTGLLIPRIIWRRFPLSQDVSIVKASEQALSDEASFWGGFGFYAILTMAYLVAGLSGVSDREDGNDGFSSSTIWYIWHYVPDIIVAALIGIVTGWCTGPLMPICGHWLARSSILQFLLHLSVFGLALSSQFFPYTTSAPKRIVFQHTFHTAGSSQILESTYDFSVTDSNSLLFLFKHSPEVAKELNVTSEFSFESASFSKRNDWMAIFPVSFLFSNSLKFPAQKDDILKQYEYFPELSIQNSSLNSVKGPRRVHLELSLGSLQEVWVAVLNITGPLSSWSFADNLLPGTEIFGGGPQSYICRLSGPSDGNWTFWLEANSSEALRVDVAVLDQKLVDPMKRLKDLFPDWVDVTAYSSFMSSYIL